MKIYEGKSESIENLAEISSIRISLGNVFLEVSR